MQHKEWEEQGEGSERGEETPFRDKKLGGAWEDP